eukprot:1048241-Prymnesium_polylepis.2
MPAWHATPSSGVQPCNPLGAISPHPCIAALPALSSLSLSLCLSVSVPFSLPLSLSPSSLSAHCARTPGTRASQTSPPSCR